MIKDDVILSEQSPWAAFKFGGLLFEDIKGIYVETVDLLQVGSPDLTQDLDVAEVSEMEINQSAGSQSHTSVAASINSIGDNLSISQRILSHELSHYNIASRAFFHSDMSNNVIRHAIGFSDLLRNWESYSDEEISATINRSLSIQSAIELRTNHQRPVHELLAEIGTAVMSGNSTQEKLRELITKTDDKLFSVDGWTHECPGYQNPSSNSDKFQRFTLSVVRSGLGAFDRLIREISVEKAYELFALAGELACQFEPLEAVKHHEQISLIEPAFVFFSYLGKFLCDIYEIKGIDSIGAEKLADMYRAYPQIRRSEYSKISLESMLGAAVANPREVRKKSSLIYANKESPSIIIAQQSNNEIKPIISSRDGLQVLLINFLRRLFILSSTSGSNFIKHPTMSQLFNKLWNFMDIESDDLISDPLSKCSRLYEYCYSNELIDKYSNVKYNLSNTYSKSFLTKSVNRFDGYSSNELVQAAQSTESSVSTPGMVYYLFSDYDWADATRKFDTVFGAHPRESERDIHQILGGMCSMIFFDDSTVMDNNVISELYELREEILTIAENQQNPSEFLARLHGHAMAQIITRPHFSGLNVSSDKTEIMRDICNNLHICIGHLDHSPDESTLFQRVVSEAMGRFYFQLNEKDISDKKVLIDLLDEFGILLRALQNMGQELDVTDTTQRCRSQLRAEKVMLSEPIGEIINDIHVESYLEEEKLHTSEYDHPKTAALADEMEALSEQFFSEIQPQRLNNLRAAREIAIICPEATQSICPEIKSLLRRKSNRTYSDQYTISLLLSLAQTNPDAVSEVVDVIEDYTQHKNDFVTDGAQALIEYFSGDAEKLPTIGFVGAREFMISQTDR